MEFRRSFQFRRRRAVKAKVVETFFPGQRRDDLSIYVIEESMVIR